MSLKRQCAILIGGQGTRLGSLVHDTPKPMLEVDGYPFVVHIIKQLTRFGFKDFILLTGYRGEVVEAYFGDGSVAKMLGVSIRCCREEFPLGTGGAILHAKELLAREFLLCNGDSYFECNAQRLVFPFADNASLGRIALRHIMHNTRYGSVRVADERVLAFNERDESNAAGLMNAGLYYLKREIIQCIPENRPSSLERDIFPDLAEKKFLEYTEFPESYFIDIGIVEDLARVRHEWVKKITRPAIFFDRDGVLNRDTGYTHRPEDFCWLGDAQEAILYANDHGYNVFVVTNQAGIARGYYTEKDMRQLHQHMQQELSVIGAHIDDFAFCPHHPEGIVAGLNTVCLCRKPENGMVERLLAEWPTNRTRSLLVGDKQSDVAAGEKSLLTTHLFTAEESLYSIVRTHIEKH